MLTSLSRDGILFLVCINLVRGHSPNSLSKSQDSSNVRPSYVLLPIDEAPNGYQGDNSDTFPPNQNFLIPKPLDFHYGDAEPQEPIDDYREYESYVPSEIQVDLRGNFNISSDLKDSKNQTSNDKQQPPDGTSSYRSRARNLPTLPTWQDYAKKAREPLPPRLPNLFNPINNLNTRKKSYVQPESNFKKLKSPQSAEESTSKWSPIKPESLSPIVDEKKPSEMDETSKVNPQVSKPKNPRPFKSYPFDEENSSEIDQAPPWDDPRDSEYYIPPNEFFPSNEDEAYQPPPWDDPKGSEGYAPYEPAEHQPWSPDYQPDSEDYDDPAKYQPWPSHPSSSSSLWDYEDDMPHKPGAFRPWSMGRPKPSRVRAKTKAPGVSIKLRLKCKLRPDRNGAAKMNCKGYSDERDFKLVPSGDGRNKFKIQRRRRLKHFKQRKYRGH